MTDLLLLSLLPAALGYLLDRRFADPGCFHPIVGMGQLVGWGERRLNRGRLRRLWGALYNGGLVLLMGGLGYLPTALVFLALVPSMLDTPIYIYVGLSLLLLVLLPMLVFFFMISGTTLIREVRMVFQAVERSVDEGRAQVGRIVGRDTASLSAQEIRLAALETLSENLSDGVVAPMLSWGLLGTPGILMYKMINTQDSMVGYLNNRYRLYGWFSAKMDDLVNFVPARLTALFMLISVGRLDLLPFVYKYGRCHLSPNSGYPEAALAGILGCRFGGPHNYFGVEVYKPYIGEVERPLTIEDMQRAVSINRRVEWLTLVIAVLLRYTVLLIALRLGLGIWV
ncbi:MAG: adenosylcobinamide-phosphate synthase CbiB [Porphyromonadaceae bacterium]|nr:adenosylcobinamide-phosphate synthase CbiB [Porphyromonadaceae bacterium]